ncbi:hypothetical protein [Fontibacillus sp. BL9]|uniref:hypothetical protein n=1 Tax=Fontibacillus sp. BL9 TaxID=3389971 RepID=UPI00397C76C9
MKKRWILTLLIILAIFMLIGINNLNKYESESDDIWVSIENQEWENYENFAGTGMYFYEENNKKNCLFMMYGSGLPVIGHYTSEVKIRSNREIEIEVPKYMVELKATDKDLERYRIELMQGSLIINKMIYEASKEPRNYKYILK